MAKPESNFIKRIHRKLDKKLYKQSMGLTIGNGTPDYYYEGNAGHIWVEYKWYPNEPKEVDLCNLKKKPCLSALQQHWLQRAFRNNQLVAVVAGYPGGCIVLPGMTWALHHNEQQVKNMKIPESLWVETLNALIISTSTGDNGTPESSF